MKYLFLLAICVLHASARDIFDNSDKFFKTKCNHEEEETFYDNFQKASEQFVGAIENLIERPADDYKAIAEKICTDTARETLREAFQILVKSLEPCMDDQEKYMKSFLSQVSVDVYEQVCHGDDFELFFETFEYLELCGIEKFQEECLKNTALYTNFKNETFIYEKEQLCNDVEFLQTCANTAKPCTFILKEFIKLVTKSPAKWCTENGL